MGQAGITIRTMCFFVCVLSSASAGTDIKASYCTRALVEVEVATPDTEVPALSRVGLRCLRCRAVVILWTSHDGQHEASCGGLFT